MLKEYRVDWAKNNVKISQDTLKVSLINKYELTNIKNKVWAH